jgi:hypothetical protein
MNHVQRLFAAVIAAAATAATMGASSPAASSAPAAPAAPATKEPAMSAMDHEHHEAAAAPAAGVKRGPQKGTYTTIVGEVMDPACFLEAGAKSIGPGHFQCAVDCARSGQTLAIYDRANDRIYFIAGELPGKNPNDPVMAYIHKKVDVSGTVYHRADAYGIVINKVALHRDAAPPAAPQAKGDGK